MPAAKRPKARTPRPRLLTVRLSATEMRELRARARATGETMSAYVMRVTLGAR